MHKNHPCGGFCASGVLFGIRTEHCEGECQGRYESILSGPLSHLLVLRGTGAALHNARQMHKSCPYGGFCFFDFSQR